MFLNRLMQRRGIYVLFCFLASLVAESTSSPVAVNQNNRPSSSRQSNVRGDENQKCSLSDSSDPTVDLGYSVYKGFDIGGQLFAWNKIRYAAPPTGTMRWQPPSSPATATDTVISATAEPQTYMCPNAGASTGAKFQDCGDLTGDTVPSQCRTTTSEDCLFLNVLAPKNAVNLPVLVLIHGGGYAMGNSDFPLGSLMQSNNNSFVVVSIQYRLGAFGFLSSKYVKKEGTLNAGLLDQQFALKWVQENICKFGGDSSRITIAGQSAGGGSVLFQILAENGTLSNSLFKNAISASPYVPQIYTHGDDILESYFSAFAKAVGCNDLTKSMECLRSKGTEQLQGANRRVIATGPFRTWAFAPVVDGTFLSMPPSEQLSTGNLNGERILTGHVANEGTTFVPQNISTLGDLLDYLERKYPLVDPYDIFAAYDATEVLDIGSEDQHDGSRFATTGVSAEERKTALVQSSLATGFQQFANNLYAETTFVCPSYWLADAHARSGLDAFKYQYSISPGTHLHDLMAYFAAPAKWMNRDFQRAVQQMWGNFVINDNPSVSDRIANGITQQNGTPNAASQWAKWTLDERNMLNLNESRGSPGSFTLERGSVHRLKIPINTEPGLINDFKIVDAVSWEGGRGKRCDFWLRQARNIPV